MTSNDGPAPGRDAAARRLYHLAVAHRPKTWEQLDEPVREGFRVEADRLVDLYAIGEEA